jgi:hypothetical protein
VELDDDGAAGRLFFANKINEVQAASFLIWWAFCRIDNLKDVRWAWSVIENRQAWVQKDSALVAKASCLASHSR